VQHKIGISIGYDVGGEPKPGVHVLVIYYNWAIWGPVIIDWQGRKMAPLKHPWSTMVSMLLKPWLLGRPMIKSIAIWVKGGAFSGTVIL